jgi:AcrR family transcriptional regulator
LSRAGIVKAGVAIADRHGLAAVSIRRIAAQLESSPMALYHYVPSKRDLLNLMLDACHAEFEWPAAPIPGWRGVLGHFARESRRSLKRHPWASVLRADDPEYGPGGIRTLESLLTRLFQFGLDMRTAIRAIGVVFVFVNGFVTEENVPRKPANQPRFSKAILATGKFPNVVHFVEMGAELPDDEGFERALKWILDGIEADVQTQRHAHAARRKKSA